MFELEDDDDSPIRKSESADRVRRVKASFAHLLDLKRQGYSPRYCELVIDRATDRIIALPQCRPTRGRA